MPDESPARKQPTRNDVAERAKVSTAIVSHVVTGAKRVSPEYTRRVLAAIDELGYRPNKNARALRTGRTEVLALLIPDVSNPYYAEFALQIEIAASERGHVLITANTHDDPEVELRLLREMGSRNVDGIIIASVFHGNQPRPPEYGEIPTLLIDAFQPADGLPTIGLNATESAKTIVQHLAEVHRCVSIALAMGPSSGPADPADPRKIGWAEALTAAGLPMGQVSALGWTREDGRQAAKRLLTGPSRPDAIFAASDQIGIGLIRGVADLGLRVPEDVKVISYDGTLETAFTVPRLTTLQQPIQEMARSAIDTIIDYTPQRALHTVFQGELVLRESCGCGDPTPKPIPKHP